MIAYFPTDEEIDTVKLAAPGSAYGEEWEAEIATQNPDGTYNLRVHKPDGTTVAKLNVSLGPTRRNAKGKCDYGPPKRKRIR
jgi:hypothetical protein